MKIKKREVILSIVIITIMVIIGLVISDKINQSLLEQYLEYDTAVQIDTEELFRYGMSTNIGNAFVYGDLKAVDTVSFPEIEGKYSYIKKEEQEYRRHTRTKTEKYKDANGKTRTRTKTETYWSWDTMRTERKNPKKISFLNVEFEYGKIPFPPSQYISTVKTGYHKRNVYYGTGIQFKGTIYTTLKNDTIEETPFYENQTIEQTIGRLETGAELVIFWIFWILLTVGVVVGFYYLENKWLD